MFPGVLMGWDQWSRQRQAWSSGIGAQSEHVHLEEQSQVHDTYHGPSEDMRSTTPQRSCGRKPLQTRRRLIYTLAATAIPSVMAQNCVSLAGSTQCPAFNSSSISTDSTLTGLFPFLSNVTDRASFDTGLQVYIAGAYTTERYDILIGCSAYNASDTTNYYARFTTSVICNAIVQNSIDACALTGTAAAPLCADTCAQYAESEQLISASNYCGNDSSNAISQIRADFTDCALPADSLSGSCIEGVTNQPDNCGFSSNKGALCSYCAASSPNATDSCCVFSDTETECEGVVLPVVATSTLSALFTSSTSHASEASATSSKTATAAGHKGGLSGGAIAGIVLGSILGAFLLLALFIGACVLFRRRQQNSPASSVFNQPVQARRPGTAEMAFRNDGAHSQRESPSVLPGGRVTRMSALESAPADGDDRNGRATTAKSLSDAASTRSPAGMASAPPRRRPSGSLSGDSMLAMGGVESSPGENFSSPETTRSEQLEFFKDYYSPDEIHRRDLVAALWAYQPRANDEFELERGDMLKVLGIWDDGWATGVRVRMDAEDWRPEDKTQRDSGMSSSRSTSPSEYGQVKAFPLVCVCLPQHWRKTIEGESTEDTGGLSDMPRSRSA